MHVHALPLTIYYLALAKVKALDCQLSQELCNRFKNSLFYTSSSQFFSCRWGTLQYNCIATYLTIQTGEADDVLAVDQLFRWIFMGIYLLAFGAHGLNIHD